MLNLNHKKCFQHMFKIKVYIFLLNCFGELKKESLLEIWNGKKLRDIQLLHIQKQRKKIEICKNCTYLHTAKDNVDNLTEEKFMERVSSR